MNNDLAQNKMFETMSKAMYPLTANMKLKVFGLLSVDPSLKDLFTPDVMQKLKITIVPAFTFEEAVNLNLAILDSNGAANMMNGLYSTWRYYDEMIPQELFDKKLLTSTQHYRDMIRDLNVKIEGIEKPDNEKKEIKSKEMISAYVRYAFESATDEEREVMESVLSKFNQRNYATRKTSE